MAGRRLNPDERALWMRVAASVRRSNGGIPAKAEPETAEPAPIKSPKAKVIVRAAKPPIAVAAKPKPKARPIPGVTLDGSWDKRIASGGAAPEMTIDLHGCNVEQAHRRLLHELDAAIADEIRVVLVVTGKAPRGDASRIDLPLRGIIRASIQDWVAASHLSGLVAAIRSAHPRHGGAGALYIILRRTKGGASARHN